MQNPGDTHPSHPSQPDSLATSSLDGARRVAQRERIKGHVRHQRTGFLHLPFELRTQIYEYYIPQGHTISVLKPWLLYQAKKFLLVSRQVTADILYLLFTRNTFEVPLNAEGEQALRDNFSSQTRRLMNSLLITAVPIGPSYCRSHPDIHLWVSLIPHLRSLQIILSQPIVPGPRMTLAIKRWVYWLTPYLDIFHRLLKPSTTVLADVNNQPFAHELIKLCLPSKSNFVRLGRGDLIFLRGMFFSYAFKFSNLLRPANIRYRL